MKKLLVLLLAAAMLMLAACTADNTSTEPSDDLPAEKIDLSVAVLSGPTGMGAVKVMQDAQDGTTANNYTFTVASSPDELTPSIINGEFQIACVPTNLAAVLYNKTQGGIKVAALNTLGVLYILSNEEIASVADLRGKTVYATNQGSTPEYILNYVLTGNGLTVGEDVTVEFTDADTLSAGLASGDIAIGMLPEPKVTATLSAGENVKIALDMTEEWNKIDNASEVVQGCVVVNSAFAAEHPDAVNAFLSEYQASVAYIESNPEDAAGLCETHGIIPKAAVAKKAYPNCNITYVDGDKMKSLLQTFLNVLYEANPQSVGGALPGDDFFYEK